MEDEMKNFFWACLAIFVSLCYCHCIGKTVPKGVKRLTFVLPIVCLFLYLPLNLRSINCAGITGLFISWLANLKLLLFAFGKGPLCTSDDFSGLGHFVANACLPIEIRKNPRRDVSNTKSNSKWLAIYATKGLVLALLVLCFSSYKQHMHQKAIMLSYCLYVFLILDLGFVAMSVAARAITGAELEPHFDEPYLATSLQDFWGRRWNLAISRALRHTIYEPSLPLWARLMGRRWATVPAVMWTFVVSGLMHELIYFYWARVRPTWEVTWFFVIHGFCLTAEIVVKKAVAGRHTWRPPRAIVGPLTVLFVMESCFRLMFPQILRCGADVRLMQEYAAIGAFFKNIVQILN